MIAWILAAAVSWVGLEDFPDATPEMKAMPLEVRTLIARRAYCNHFWGEPTNPGSRDPADRGRIRQIEQALRELRCASVEGEERRLGRRYAKAPAILKALDETQDWLP